MASILVGIFENSSDAQATSKELVLAGVDSQAIRLSGREWGTATAGTEHDSSDADDKPGAISRFFADIFGINDDAAYTDAVERGNVVLTVKLSDSERVDELSAILENGGAIEVDERVEPWQSEGAAPSAIGQSTLDSIEDLPYGSLPPEGDARRPSQRYDGAERRYNVGAGYMGVERRALV